MNNALSVDINTLYIRNTNIDRKDKVLVSITKIETSNIVSIEKSNIDCYIELVGNTVVHVVVLPTSLPIINESVKRINKITASIEKVGHIEEGYLIIIPTYLRLTQYGDTIVLSNRSWTLT